MNYQFNIRRCLIVILTLIVSAGAFAAVGNGPEQKASRATPLVKNAPKPIAVSGDLSLEPLRGDEAIRQLKQQGAYLPLMEAMTAAMPPPLWQQQKQLTADDGTPGDLFGSSVSISGNTAIIGAREAGPTDLGGAGAAYIFVRNGSTWSLQQKLMGEDGAGGIFDVAISGDTAFVAFPYATVLNDHGGVNSEQGEVDVFVRNGSTWSLQEILTATDGGVGHRFGFSIGLSGDTAVIGTLVNRAYIFERTGTAWTQQALIHTFIDPTAAEEGRETFGGEVAISGDIAIVSSFEDVGERNSSGAVNVYTHTGATWAEGQKLTADDRVPGDVFGTSIAISGSTFIVAYYNTSPDLIIPSDLARKGAYFFARTGGTWSQQDKLDISEPVPYPMIPTVAISGDNAIVGLDKQESGYEGKAFLYTRTSGTWFYQQTLDGSNGAENDRFGFSVAISGGTGIVGAWFDDVLGGNAADGTGTNQNQGSAYVFVKSPDADGDGLPDDWEENGVEIDGVFIDLPAMGADPMHKDIFVHADWMALSPTGTVLKPDPTAIKMVMDAFATAPVENPDDEDGINLHVDLGPDSIMNPITDVTWGFYSRAGETAFQEDLGTLSGDDGNYEWYAFDAVKAERFDDSRRKAIFHYALFCNSFAGTEYSGVSRGGPAADFLVSLGKEHNSTSPGGTTEHVPAGGTVMQQAGTFMHELGHNLGLKHGGGDNIIFKPNYLSVMNYYFQFSGLLDVNGQRTLDYSPIELPALIQTNLDESVGIRDPGEHLPLWNGPARPDVPSGSNRCRANENTYYKLFSPGLGVDWNCDGALTLEAVSTRLVNDATAPDTLNGFDDWASLRFDAGGRIGDLGLGGSDVPTTPIDELPVEQILSAMPPAFLDEEFAAPHDVVTVTPRAGAAPLTVNFNGSASTAVTGTITNWSWNFGDGSTGSGATVQHNYTTAGTYFASLSVTDSNGRMNLVPLLHRITVGGTSTATPTPSPTPTLPNLTPYQLSGWADKLIVSNIIGTNTDSSPLLARDTLFLDFAMINNGAGATAAPFQAKIYVDAVEVHSFTVNPPLNASEYTFIQDYPLGSLTAGQHAVRIVADANAEIAEGDETDNEYTKMISVSPSTPAFVSRQNGDYGNPCTWNVPNGNGQCSGGFPGATDSVEINHVVANAGGSCESLILSGSISGGGSISITGDLQILGGTVNVELTVGGNTSVTGGVLNKRLRTRDISVNGTFGGSGSILVDRAGAGNTVSFINNGTVTVTGVTFGLANEAFNYAVAGTGIFNTSQFSAIAVGNTLEVTGAAQMNGGMVVNSGSTLNVTGALTFGSGNFVNANVSSTTGLSGTVVVNGSLNFNGTATISNNGTINIPGGRMLNFNGDRFDTGGGNGVVIGTGTIRFAPSDGTAIFGASGFIEPGVTIASGTIQDPGSGNIKGPVVVDAGATFAMNFATLYVHDDVTNSGTITFVEGGGASSSLNFIGNGRTFTNNGTIGAIGFVSFYDSNLAQNGPHSQFIAGTGSWAAKNVNIGGFSQSTQSYIPTIVTMLADGTFNGRQLFISALSELNIGGHTLTYNNPKNFAGKVTGTGTGLVKIHSTESDNVISIDAPSLEIATGAVRASYINVEGNMTINPGATMSLSGYSFRASGDVMIKGTLDGVIGAGGGLGFAGNTFTNNGTINGDVSVNFGNFTIGGPSLTQSLRGTGAWANRYSLYIGTSTTTLLNDINYDGGTMYIDGRLNTGVYSLRMPCSTMWSGSGDVVGNIIRTNLAACPGAAIAYGNPFSTIQFTSGTPPAEMAFNAALASPSGFPAAARRTYLITPTGGSGYTATLRLHYLDSELNGNAESTLQLWRNNGSTWLAHGATNRSLTDNWVEYAGVTQFSPWTISGTSVTPTSTQTPTSTPTSTPCPPVKFSNLTPILVPASGTSGVSNPYPLNISVAGLTGNVTKVTVTLTNFNHTFLDDVDIMLVGPAGQNAIIVSDVGGSNDASNLTLTLDDTGVGLPNSGQLISGTFQPTNIGTGDAFPAPAPAPLGGSALSIFNGTVPNGIWSLYVIDDSSGDIGNFNGGWALTISTDDTLCGSPTTQTPTPTPTSTPASTPTSTPTPTPVPSAPSALTAAAVSTSNINLAWTDNSGNETGFKIERCTGKTCTNFVEVAQTAANVAVFANIGLLRNTQYRYRVRAFNSDDNSVYSNIATAKTLTR